MTYRLNVVTLKMVRERTLPSEVKKVGSPDDAVTIFAAYLDGADREHFVAMYLDTKHQVTALHTVSIGSLNATVVHPREVFKGALLANAAALVVAHNHPSGDPTPSEEDVQVTNRLAAAAKVLGIELLDHVVLGHQCHVSFRERGLLGFE